MIWGQILMCRMFILNRYLLKIWSLIRIISDIFLKIIFAKRQRFVKKLLPYEIFVANIEAGNDEPLIIKALVESFDLRICGNSRPGCICCVATLEDLYRKYGYDILQRSLRLCIATWEGEVDSLTIKMGKAL